MFNNIEKFLNRDVLFSFIVMSQALFGSFGLVQTPERLQKVSKNKYARFLFLCLIAYTATQQIEIVVPVVIIFLMTIWLLRTEEERKAHSIF